MKKFASLILSLALVLGLAAPALATQLSTAAEATEESQVTYSSGVQEGYIVEVPATIAAGSSAAYNVKVTGAWDVDKTLTVTTPGTVTLTDSESDETVTANVTFAGITQGGSRAHDFNGENAITQSISVAAPQNALFGTWTGTLTYSVSFQTAQLTGITAQWTADAPTSPTAGSTVDKDTIQVTASYDNNTSVTLDSDDFTVSPTTWAANTTRITVSYTKDSVTKTTNLAFTGTVTNPLSLVKIGSSEDWEAFVAAYNADDGTYADDVNVVIIDRILVRSKTLSPLGKTTRPFNGIFDGQGQTINGLSEGIFDCLGNGAEVKNVTFANADISVDKTESLFGDVVGGNVTIKNIQVCNFGLDRLFGSVTGNVTFDADCKMIDVIFTVEDSSSPVASSGAENVDYSAVTFTGCKGWVS